MPPFEFFEMKYNIFLRKLKLLNGLYFFRISSIFTANEYRDY